MIKYLISYIASVYSKIEVVIKYINLLCFLFCCIFMNSASGQDSLVLVRSVELTGTDKVSQDSYGNLYLSDKKGNIHKFDSLGNYQLNYSPQKLGTITLLDAWNTIRIFVFYRDFQEYAVLERFLGSQPNSPLNQDQVGFARLASLGSDYNLWVIDETDFTLKKYDRQFNKVTNRTSLDLLLDTRDYDIAFMREYQNNLYMADRNSGILVFDAFGSYKKKIPFKGMEFFSFRDEEMYYLERDTIRFFHLYLFTQKFLKLPPGKNYRRVLIYNRKLFAIKPDGVDLYEILKSGSNLR